MGSFRKKNKQQLLDFVGLRTGYHDKTIMNVIVTLGDYIRQEVFDADVPTTVTVPGIGKLKITLVGGKKVTHPRTGEKSFKPPKKKITIIPDSTLTSALESPIND